MTMRPRTPMANAPLAAHGGELGVTLEMLVASVEQDSDDPILPSHRAYRAQLLHA